MENFTTEALKDLLSNSLPILCKNALSISDVNFSIEALVGVSVGGDVIMASIKEVVSPDGKSLSYCWRSGEESVHSMPQDKSMKAEAGGAHVAAPNQQYNTDDNTPTYISDNNTPINIKPEIDSYSDQQQQQYNNNQLAIQSQLNNTYNNNNDYNNDYNNNPSQHFAYQNKVKQAKRSTLSGSKFKGQMAKVKMKKFPAQIRHKSFKTSAGRGKGSTTADSYNNIVNEICQQAVDQSMSMETSFVCHICQARRCSRSSLVNHIRGTHLAIEKFQCRVCGAKFRWFMQLHRHRKKFHGDAETENANNNNNNDNNNNDNSNMVDGSYIDNNNNNPGVSQEYSYGENTMVGDGYGNDAGGYGDGSYGDEYVDGYGGYNDGDDAGGANYDGGGAV